jgi:hypothetical protein
MTHFSKITFRSDGFSHKAILLPVDHPFDLMRYTSTCQDVYVMIVKEEVFMMNTEDSTNRDSCNGAHPFDPGYGYKDHELHYCYYERQSDINFPSIIIGYKIDLLKYLFHQVEAKKYQP